MEWSGQDSWDLEQSVKLAHLLPELGVDLLDVSSGGNNSEQKIQIHPYYQVNLAGEIRAGLKKAGKELLIGAVGMITNAEMAVFAPRAKTRRRVRVGLRLTRNRDRLHRLTWLSSHGNS